MPTKKRGNKKEELEKKVRDLGREVAMLRSAVMSVIGKKDPEGEYRPEYVKKILSTAKKMHGSIAFTDVDDFFGKIRSRK